ncbi:MAG: V-type ATPase subunit [Candidatus Thermoplasmatota archaeon]
MFDWLTNPYHITFWIPICGGISLVVFLIARPLSTYMKFIYPTAKYEAIGNPFILQKELDSILELSTVSEFKEKINQKKDYVLQGDSSGEIQKSLDSHVLRTLDMMKKDSSKKMQAFFDTYRKKYDLFFVKNELKKKLLGISSQNISNESLLPWAQRLLQDIYDTSPEKYPELLESYGFNQAEVLNLKANLQDVFLIDAFFDAYFLRELYQVKVPYKCDSAKRELVQTLIDIYTIKHVLRAKHLGYDHIFCKKLYLGPGREIAPWKFTELIEQSTVSHVLHALEGTSYYTFITKQVDLSDVENSLQKIENILDIYLLQRMKELSMKNYINIGPTIRFLISKEFEIQNLKIICKGINENVSKETIKKFLITEGAP